MTTPSSHPSGRFVADVDRFFADVAVERARRNSELGAAQDRLAVAEARLRAVAADARAELADLTATAEAELARMEEAHRRTVDALTSAADQQAAEIMAACGGSADQAGVGIGPAETDR